MGFIVTKSFYLNVTILKKSDILKIIGIFMRNFWINQQEKGFFFWLWDQYFKVFRNTRGKISWFFFFLKAPENFHKKW